MNAPRSTLPLDWRALCGHVRRPWLAGHRGELPPRPHRPARLDAPLGIAACAQFRVRHAFATERENEIWRGVGPQALGVCALWDQLRYEREDLRVSAGVVRHWQARGATAQAALALTELRRRWAAYRRHMRLLARQLERVRQALRPRPAPASLSPALRQAAE